MAGGRRSMGWRGRFVVERKGMGRGVGRVRADGRDVGGRLDVGGGAERGVGGGGA